MDEILVVADTELLIRSISSRAETASSRARNREMIGTALTEQFSDLPAEEVKQVCSAIVSGKGLPGRARYYRKSVQRVGMPGKCWVVVIAPHEAADGSVDGVVYARIRSDPEELATRGLQPDTLYEILVEHASELVFLTDCSGVVRFVNRRAEMISGFPLSHFVGRYFAELVHPDDVARCSEMLSRTVAERTPFADFEFRAVTPDGRTYHLVANGGVAEANGEDLVLGICRDVTESVELRRKLVARNAALSALNEVFVALTRSKSVDEALQTAIDGLLAVLGVPTGGILLRGADGRMQIRVTAGIRPDREIPERQELAELLDSWCQSTSEPLMLQDIQAQPGLYESCREFAAEAGIQGIVLIPLCWGGAMNAIIGLGLPAPAVLSLDQMEFANLAAGVLGQALENAQLQEASRIKSRQLEALAKEARHRIKNNLQMIMGLLSMWEASPSGGSLLDRCLRQVRAVAAVHELLDADRLEDSLGLRDCVARVAASTISGAGRADSIRLDVDGEDAVISSETAAAVGIIVNELVSNAIVHAFADRDYGSVGISIVREGKKTVVTVTDDGVGLPPGFTMPREGKPASGLGLVRTLAQYGLGGDLKLVSDKRGGTCARITF